MASVPLTFIPPTRSGYTTLEIWESPTKDDVSTLIESVPVSQPYLTEYTTAQALSITDWFQIRWLNSDGTATDYSEKVQGGTQTLVGKIVLRMLQRDSTLDEAIAAQEAEAAISDYFGVLDPYTIDATTVYPKTLEGLTLLALGWSKMVTTLISSASTTASKFTAGLVSIDSGSSSSVTSNLDSIKSLIDLANKFLNRSFSFIGRLEEINVGGGYKQLAGVDLSRLIYEIQ